MGEHELAPFTVQILETIDFRLCGLEHLDVPRHRLLGEPNTAYQLGHRDGDVYGLRPQIYLYEHQCKAWVQASEADYMRGWVDGYREFSKRGGGGDCCHP